MPTFSDIIEFFRLSKRCSFPREGALPTTPPQGFPSVVVNREHGAKFRTVYRKRLRFLRDGLHRGCYCFGRLAENTLVCCGPSTEVLPCVCFNFLTEWGGFCFGCRLFCFCVSVALFLVRALRLAPSVVSAVFRGLCASTTESTQQWLCLK